MNALFLIALLCLLVSSLLVLFVSNELLLVLLLAVGILLLVVSIFKDRKRIVFLPLYTLVAELLLFYVTGNGLLLIFFYVLLVANLGFVFLMKKYPDECLLAGFFGKLCFLPLQALHLFLYFSGVAGPFVALAYAMLVITSAYSIAGLFARIDEPGFTMARFLIPVLLLLVPVCDIIVAGCLAWKERSLLWN